MSITSFKSIRAFAAQIGESGVPDAALFASLDQDAAFIELRLVGPSLGVTGSPTSATFTVWRNIGGQIEKIGAFTISASDIAAATALPQLYAFNARSVYVTVSFTGGTGPTLTGVLEARAVHGSVATATGSGGGGGGGGDVTTGSGATVATETTLAAASAKLPASLGAKAGSASLSIIEATDTTLAKESGGNLASIKTNTDKIPSKGTAVMTGSTPVTLATDDAAAKAVTPQGTATSLAEVTTGANTTAVQLGALAAVKGVIVQAHPTNTINVRVAEHGATSASRGLVLAPGKAVFLPVTNANLLDVCNESAVASKIEVLGV